MGTRIVTAAFGILAMAFIVESGGLLFSVVVLGIALIGWHEYARALAAKGIGSAYVTGMLSLIFLWSAASFGDSEKIVAAATIIALVMLALSVLMRSRFAFDEAMFSLGGVFYLGLPLAHFLFLRFFAGENVVTPLGSLEAGSALIWLMFIGTWASDSFAYFVGSAVGKRKLCPAISPNKTVEGFIGSLVGTSASLAALGNFLSLPVLVAGALGFFIALVATLGDAVESVFKRYVGIKDSGALFPGHGGILDRFDSALFTAPFVYYFAKFTGIIS